MHRKWWLVIDSWVIDEVENKTSRILVVPLSPFSLIPAKKLNKKENSSSSPKPAVFLMLSSCLNFSYQRSVLSNVHGVGTCYSDANVINMLCFKLEELTSVRSCNPPPLSAGDFCQVNSSKFFLAHFWNLWKFIFLLLPLTDNCTVMLEWENSF